MNPPQGLRPTWVEVDLDKLASNLQFIRAHLKQSARVMAVVKADAYGHGAVPVARHLQSLGTDAFAVASVEEGIELRQAGLQGVILILGGAFPGQEDALIEHALTPSIYSVVAWERLEQWLSQRSLTLPCHLEFDTGMTRVGISLAEAPGLLARAATSRLRIEGVFSHFSSSDSDPEFTQTQFERFDRIASAARDGLPKPPALHVANTSGSRQPDYQLDLVRVGIGLYGFDPSGAWSAGLKPILSWHSRVAQLREVPAGTPVGYSQTHRTAGFARIATVPAGYADGISRVLGNRGVAVVNGVRVPVIGTVTMDMLMLDVTGVPDVEVGSAVTLIGRSGEIEISADDHGRWAGTISYEILCRISRRVPRFYLGTAGYEKNRSEA